MAFEHHRSRRSSWSKRSSKDSTIHLHFEQRISYSKQSLIGLQARVQLAVLRVAASVRALCVRTRSRRESAGLSATPRRTRSKKEEVGSDHVQHAATSGFAVRSALTWLRMTCSTLLTQLAEGRATPTMSSFGAIARRRMVLLFSPLDGIVPISCVDLTLAAVASLLETSFLVKQNLRGAR